MAVDSFFYFGKSTGSLQAIGETQDSYFQKKSAFEISDFSLATQNVASIGSTSSGAGTGKVLFNPLTITKKVDSASPALFAACCNGSHWDTATLALRKSSGASSSVSGSGLVFLQYNFALVFVTGYHVLHDEESPNEVITLAYGALQVQYQQQDSTGAATGGMKMQAWSQVKNVNQFDVGSGSVTAI